ncbi:MAG: hypothetical protein IIW63_05505 [Clostridia bacterium]|nr:hypothetical protein [Clostridia bacterium]MBR6507759.1 hypothetical protein [Clostridia bacterium]
MHRLANAAAHILDASDEKHYIIAPTKKLLRIAVILFVVAVILLTLSSGLALIITIPFLVIEGYFYYFFCKIWRSYRYSTAWLILLPAVAVCFSTGIKMLLYYLIP